MTVLTEQPKYKQGYWVELQKGRFAGGVSAEANHWEGGLGIVSSQKMLGATGYLQYSLPLILGRMQVDFLSDRSWYSEFVVGIPIMLEDFKLEPHVALPFKQNTKPKLGLKAQYLF